jgi:hypothetical protein
MRNVISHTILGSITYGIAEYTSIASDAIQWMRFDSWIEIPMEIRSLAIAVVVTATLAHGIPLFAKSLMFAGKSILAMHSIFSNAFQAFLSIIEGSMLQVSKSALVAALEWIERVLRDN